LLACGILSSLLYVATDILGGLRYEGYSFTSQAISELMAVRAPSEAFVDPLFIAYGVLALAFAVGVFREALGHNRALQIAGALLIAYSAAGFTGPTLFEMHPRGTAGVAADTPHIVLTAVLVVRRVDPTRRTLGRFFHEEIAEPLGLEFYIGLPRAIPDERLGKVKPLTPWRGLLALRYTPPAVTMKMIRPGSLLRRSFVGLAADPNDRDYLEVEVPAGNGVGTARAIARAYSALAEGGAELGITPETFARVTAPPQVERAKDEVLGVPSYFSLGFLRPGPNVWFGSSQRAFGSPGAGGSFAFADPDARLGYAYVMNKLDFYLENDPREKALRDAVYRALARLTNLRDVPKVHAAPQRTAR
jgi:hypothetical protein